MCDTSWVSSQYDHQLFLNTVEGPGGDAVVLRLKHPTTGADTGRGLALTTDGNHRWCALDPRLGTAMTVAESVLNLACVGARPIAVVNCLNFGNPEHPEVMWQLSEAIDGLGDACRAFGLPVIGGNVSLYNESSGVDIDPTRSSACSGSSIASSGARRASASSTAIISSCSARAAGRVRREPGRIGLGVVCGTEGRHAAGVRRWSRTPSGRVGARPRRQWRCEWRARRRRRVAWVWRWPRWRCSPASGSAWPGSRAR